MRHRKKVLKIGRTASHRKATLQALANALIRHKRIQTTHAKARALRRFVEPLITRAKTDTTHNRRQVFRHLQDKESVKILFGEIAEKVAGRNGGYTRIVKMGPRHGDGAELAVIELVDYNVVETEEKKPRRRRTRRGGRKKRAEAPEAPAPAAETPSEAEPEAPAEATAPEASASEEETPPEAGEEGASPKAS